MNFLEKNSTLILVVTAVLIFASAGLIGLSSFDHDGKYVNPDEYTAEDLMVKSNQLGAGWEFSDEVKDGSLLRTFVKDGTGSIRAFLTLVDSPATADNAYEAAKGKAIEKVTAEGVEDLSIFEKSFRYYDEDEKAWSYVLLDLNVIVIILIDVSDEDRPNWLINNITSAIQKNIHKVAEKYVPQPVLQ